MGLDVVSIYKRSSNILNSEETLKEAVKQAGNVKLNGVSVLTNFSDDDLKKLGFSNNVKEQVETLTKIASSAGLYGIVCSPREVKMIKKIADDGLKVNLALSLHAASEEKRNNIMPIGESNSLTELRDSLKYYFSKIKKKITYEYILLKDINDGLEDAKDLYNFTKHVPSKVNLIEYNLVDGLDYDKSSVEKVNLFIEYLERRGLNVGIRKSRGEDINAACGQLANKN